MDVFKNTLTLAGSLLLSLLMLPGVMAREPLPTEPIATLAAHGHVTTAHGAVFSPDGRTLYTAGADKVVHAWDVDRGEWRRSFRVPVGPGGDGAIYTIAITPDGRHLAVGGFGHSRSLVYPIHVIDTQSGEITGTGIGHGNSVHGLDFSPDGRFLASASADLSVKIWAFMPDGRLTEVSNLNGHIDRVSDVRWLPDGEGFLSGGYDRRVVHWTESGGDWTPNQLEPMESQVAKIAVANKGSLAVVGDRNGNIRLYSISNGETLEKRFSQPRAVDALAFSPDSHDILTGSGMTGTGTYDIRRWSLVYSMGEPSAKYTINNAPVTELAWHPTREDLAASVGGIRNSVLIFNPLTGEVIHRFEGGGGPVFAVGGATSSIAWGSEWGRGRQGFGGELLDTSFSRPFAEVEGAVTRQGRFERAIHENDRWRLTGPNRARGILEIHHGDTHHTFSTPRGVSDRVNSWTILGENTAAVGTDTSIYIINLEDASVLRTLDAHTSGIWSLARASGGRYLVSGGQDQTTRIWNQETGELLVSIHMDNTEEWVAWTTAGYYKASILGDRLIGWQVNRGIDGTPEFYTADQFRASLNRPDVLERVLLLGSLKDALEELRIDTAPEVSASTTRLQSFLPPSVTILSPGPGTHVSGETVTVRFRVDRGTSDQPIERVNVMVNGRISRLVGRVATETISSDDIRSHEVSLSPGRNVITIIAANATAESNPVELVLHRETAAAEQEATPQATGNLYILAIGVGRFESPRIDPLPGPSTDGARLVESLSLNARRLHQEVRTRILRDEEATRDEVLDALTWLERECTQHDTAVLHIAGHGETDEGGDYYFLTHDADPDNLRRTAVPWTEVLRTTRMIPGRLLVLTDTCKAGAVTGSQIRRRATSEITNALRDLASTQGGAVVLAASTGTTFAEESSDWGGGAFTLALIEGLSGKADRLPADGIVSFKELDAYVTNRVKELTEGRQKPVTLIPPGVPAEMQDFPVSAP
ncbi:MAG: caspase family protein [Candidatus Sumerlaeia bacterium]|nr:caspase family protein [Candidatus Sumerlaeia bacterium]